MPGHQWNVLLTRRTPNAVDEFPLGELGAEWLCGTTQKPMAKVAISNAEKFKVENFSEKNKGRLYSTGPPVLTGPVVELAATRAKLNEAEIALSASRSGLEAIEGSWSWKIGGALTFPVTLLRNRFHKFHAD